MMNSFTLSCSRRISAIVAAGCAAAGLAQPTNNACSNAIDLDTTGGSVAGTTVGATNDGVGGCGSTSSPDVWYRITGQLNGNMTLTTCGGASWDTVLGVWNGCPSGGGTQIACNDDNCNLQSRLTVGVTLGTVYYIRVGGFGQATGPFTLFVSQNPVAPPANDNCANAADVGTGIVNGTTVAATNDGVGGCGSASSPDVWYRFLATVDGTLTASTCSGGATWNTVLGIWNGCPGAGGTEIVCNDDGCGLQSNVFTAVTAGGMYWIRVAGNGSATGDFSLFVSETGGGGGEGPDVVYSDISDVAQYGPVGNTYAYAFGTGTCNIGNANLRWGNSWGGSPSVGFNAYRLHDGRLVQIGQSWVKKACCAAAGNGCSMACNGVGGSMLGSGCRDSYSGGYNGSQGVLAKRSQLNPYTGAHSISGSASGDALAGRLQVRSSDLAAASFPGALYFGEGVYVASDDAVVGNAYNNASYRRFTVSGVATLNLTGSTQIGTPAIYAWRDHGLGLNTPDPSVVIDELDIADEGRFIIASKVRNLGGGTWRYDYAVFNLNSDLAGGSLTIPASGVAVTNVGFRDVDYHSGEVYDSTDWVSSTADGAVSWRSPQTFAQNPNSNALRWGTMYNFWFDADRPPVAGAGVLGLFKPHTPSSAPFAVRVPARPTDLNADGVVDLTDLATLLSAFGCDQPPCTGDVNHDGVTDLTDLAMLLSEFGT